jgi:hypothetical protein
MGERKIVDCRNVPNDVGCTLAISGTESEVMRTAVEHAISVHGEKDSPELRQGIRDSMEDEEVVLSRLRPAGVQPPAIH